MANFTNCNMRMSNGPAISHTKQYEGIYFWSRETIKWVQIYFDFEAVCV